jgi:hypothetical protein
MAFLKLENTKDMCKKKIEKGLFLDLVFIN